MADFRFHLHRAPHTQLAPTSGAMGYGVPAGIAASRLPDRIGGLVRLLIVLLVFEIGLVIFHPNHQGVLGWLFERQG